MNVEMDIKRLAMSRPIQLGILGVQITRDESELRFMYFNVQVYYIRSIITTLESILSWLRTEIYTTKNVAWDQVCCT